MLSTYFLFLQVIFNSAFSFDDSRLLPRAVAYGYSGAARIALNETVVLNPAASAYTKVYSIETGMAFSDRNTFYASISDNKNSDRAGGGVFFAKNNDFAQLNFVINKLFFNKRLAVGFGLDYKKFADGLYNGDKLFAPSAGAMYLLSPTLVIGAYIKHILQDDYGVFPRTYALGVRWSFLEFMSFSFDTLFRGGDFLISSVMEGLYKWGGGMVLGISNNFNKKQLTYSAGLGFYAPKISVYYAIEIEEQPLISTYKRLHSVSLRVFF